MCRPHDGGARQRHRGCRLWWLGAARRHPRVCSVWVVPVLPRVADLQGHPTHAHFSLCLSCDQRRLAQQPHHRRQPGGRHDGARRSVSSSSSFQWQWHGRVPVPEGRGRGLGDWLYSRQGTAGAHQHQRGTITSPTRARRVFDTRTAVATTLHATAAIPDSDSDGSWRQQWQRRRQRQRRARTRQPRPRRSAPPESAMHVLWHTLASPPPGALLC